MKLYLTLPKDRKWDRVGEYVEARDWTLDSSISCAQGLHGCSTEADQGWYVEVLANNIFLEIEVEDKDVVKVVDEGRYRFRRGKILREWVIGKDTYKEIWGLLSGGNLIWAGITWKGITREMLQEGWGRLEGQALFFAGLWWKNVTREIKVEGLKRLEGKWLERAKVEWEECA